VGKYSSIGPDLTDCETLMRGIEALHGGQLQLTVTPAGISATGGLSVVLTWTTPSVDGVLSGDPLVIVNRWPCPVHKEFWACVFEALYQMDTRIGRGYVQTSLTEG
jgi:hypothetical protein